jgi:FkbM family methyltransferase
MTTDHAMRAVHKKLTSVLLVKRRRDFLGRIDVRRRDDLLQLGTSYGGWTIPGRLLGPDSVCYLAGIGEDITFDLHLIARFGCVVHAFDPVPRSQGYAAEATAHEPRFVLHRFGLWSRDGTLHFHAPETEGHISHSATNLKGTRAAFDAPVRCVRTVLGELGHERIDLLKLSVEGSEYEILDHVLSEQIPVHILCVEYAQPAPLERMEASVRQLESAGFVTADARITPWNWKLLFVAS